MAKEDPADKGRIKAEKRSLANQARAHKKLPPPITHPNPEI
jgi:hypothetical protein